MKPTLKKRYQSKLRRGMAPLELVMALPVFLVLFCAVLYLCVGGMRQIEVDVEARNKTWRQRLDAKTETRDVFIFKNKDELLKNQSSKEIKTSTAFDRIGFVAEGSHILIGGDVWDEYHLKKVMQYANFPIKRPPIQLMGPNGYVNLDGTSLEGIVEAGTDLLWDEIAALGGGKPGDDTQSGSGSSPVLAPIVPSDGGGTGGDGGGKPSEDIAKDSCETLRKKIDDKKTELSNIQMKIRSTEGALEILQDEKKWAPVKMLGTAALDILSKKRGSPRQIAALGQSIFKGGLVVKQEKAYLNQIFSLYNNIEDARKKEQQLNAELYELATEYNKKECGPPIDEFEILEWYAGANKPPRNVQPPPKGDENDPCYKRNLQLYEQKKQALKEMQEAYEAMTKPLEEVKKLESISKRDLAFAAGVENHVISDRIVHKNLPQFRESKYVKWELITGQGNPGNHALLEKRFDNRLTNELILLHGRRISGGEDSVERLIAKFEGIGKSLNSSEVDKETDGYNAFAGTDEHYEKNREKLKDTEEYKAREKARKKIQDEAKNNDSSLRNDAEFTRDVVEDMLNSNDSELSDEEREILLKIEKRASSIFERISSRPKNDPITEETAKLRDKDTKALDELVRESGLSEETSDKIIEGVRKKWEGKLSEHNVENMNEEILKEFLSEDSGKKNYDLDTGKELP